MTVSGDPSDDRSAFEEIDWDEVGGRRLHVSSRARRFLTALAGLVALFYYDYSGMAGSRLVGDWDPVVLDWLYLLALLLFVFLVVEPAVRNRGLTRRYWRRFRRNRLAVAALAYLVVLLLVGTVGPLLLGRPEINLPHQNQPPLGFTVERGPIAYQCLGENVGNATHPRCGGTWHHPLGTDGDGKDVITLLVTGARVTLLVSLVAAMLIAPIATVVGTVAGYLGGLVDDVLMGYVDVQQTVPAFVVYVILIFVFERSLLLIVAVFGLLSWGGAARLVRSEVMKRRDAPYVLVARSQGASHLDVLRRHVLPSVSSTVVTSTTRAIPALVLTEAAIAYLGLSDAILYSWGFQIGDTGIGLTTWWVWLFPSVLLGATLLAFVLVGDALRDALDPRGDAA